MLEICRILGIFGLPQTNQDTKVGHIDAIMLTVELANWYVGVGLFALLENWAKTALGKKV